MAIHDHSNVSSSALPEGDSGISLDAGEQIPAGECHVPKMRKPYTITKQRERWTGEEHEKFLEAMKLYGRAWRKIEEHVGTKTAVQIRSHAQKFFSKVARESSHGNPGSIEPIDIPPPRPKRKPAHPYPRKLARPTKKDVLQEQLARSVSPISSVNQANRSPTSVLSTLDGNTRSSADWERMDGSSSPVSSPDNLNSAECLPSEAGPKLPKPISPKLELHPGVDAFGKDGSGETTSAKRLRLFGKTLSVNHDVAEVEEISDAGAANPENSACQISPTLVPYLCYMNENGVPIPCWPVYGGIQIPFVTPSNADSLGRAEGDLKDGSSSGSDPVSMNASGSCDGNSDSETQSYEMVKNGRNLISQPSSIVNLKSSSSGSSEKPQRGFVPYRRSLSEREGRSFVVTGTKEESEMVRLSL